MNNIAVGSDHGGYDLKNEIIGFLKDAGYSYQDFGCNDRKSVHYPDYAFKVCRAVVEDNFECGILICGTGIGMSIAANKVSSARMTREHNDSNILTMGGRVIGVGLAIDIVKIWLNTEFSKEERHIVRLKKIEEYQQE